MYKKAKEKNCVRKQISRQNVSTPDKNAICVIDQKCKAAKREWKCSEKGMKRCYEIVMKNPESQILSTCKKKKIVTQIEEILGSDSLSHVEVLATIVKKAYKSPIKRKPSWR